MQYQQGAFCSPGKLCCEIKTVSKNSTQLRNTNSSLLCMFQPFSKQRCIIEPFKKFTVLEPAV